MNKDSAPQSPVTNRDKAILLGLVVIVIITTILYFVFTWQTEEPADEETTVTENQQEIVVISAPELNSIINSDDPFILLDVRRSVEYAEEHIPGATNIELAELENMIKYLPNDIQIITMCDGSKCQRSQAAAKNLVDWGFKRVSNFKGGTEEWKADAQATTIGVVSEIRYLQIPEMTAHDLKTSIDSGIGINVIDVRNATDYSQGHIPGARNVSFVDVENMAQTNAINLDKAIVIYGGNSPVKAEMAAQTLLANGAKDLSLLTEGFPAWENKGYQTK